ncbi:MAG: PLDc N-terminal domain-containing protein, partial [Paludibacteraceae bacterium]|nr:PLDc N-terminal domain-containing protein [Paludibacteraceae bacterium]
MVWLILAIIFISLYIYTILTTISVVLLENRTPQKSVVWVLILLLVPVFGLIFYLIFGQDIRRRKYLSRKNLKKIQGRLRIPR